MQIFWLGQSMVKIETKEATVVLDPFVESKLKVEPDIAICTSVGASCEGLKGKPFTVAAQGEYEIKDVFILSYEVGSGKGKHLISRVEIDNISIAHLSDLSIMPDKSELEALEGVDILILPVGGHSVLDAKMAGEIIAQIEPKMVIPVYFSVPDLKNGDALDGAEAFLKQMGAKNIEAVDKLNVKWQDFGEEEEKMNIVVLNAQI